MTFEQRCKESWGSMLGWWGRVESEGQGEGSWQAWGRGCGPKSTFPSTILFDTHNNSVYEGSYYVHVIDEGLRFSYVSTCPMQHSKQQFSHLNLGLIAQPSFLPLHPLPHCCVQFCVLQLVRNDGLNQTVLKGDCNSDGSGDFMWNCWKKRRPGGEPHLKGCQTEERSVQYFSRRHN